MKASSSQFITVVGVKSRVGAVGAVGADTTGLLLI